MIRVSKIFFLVLVSLSTNVEAQKDSIASYNELNISVNRTLVHDDNTENRFGFGLGFSHSFLPTKKINLNVGVEYNLTSLYKKEMYEGIYAYSTKSTYYINSISVPLVAQLQMGKKTKAFLEGGFFLDATVFSERVGTMHTFKPYQGYEEYQFKEKEDFALLNYGPVCGLGVKIPIKKKEISIKADYKLGLHVLYENVQTIHDNYFKITVGCKI